MTTVTDWRTPEGERKARDAYAELAARAPFLGVRLDGTRCHAAREFDMWHIWGGHLVVTGHGETLAEAYADWAVRYQARLEFAERAREEARRRKRTLDTYALEGEGGIAR